VKDIRRATRKRWPEKLGAFLFSPRTVLRGASSTNDFGKQPLRVE
jgi:hypothetical protein